MIRTILISFTFLLISCANNLKMMVPPLPKSEPEVTINPELLARINSIAVLPFRDSDKSVLSNLPKPFPEGSFKQRYPYKNDGEVIADGIATYLTRSLQFRVVDRQYTEILLKEQALQHSGIVNEGDAIKVGKMTGADGLLIGKVNICLLSKQWKYKGSAYISQEIGIINVDFKIIDTETGELAVIVHHELTSQNIMDKPVELVNTRIIENANYYSGQVPSLDFVIKTFYKETLEPVIEMKKSKKG